MKCKYSAYIENTPEMREWLESIGYNRSGSLDGDTLCTVYDGGYEAKNYILGKTKFQVYLNIIKPINCLGNPSLFKAVTAVRDDSDMEQWFIADSDICINWYDDSGFACGYDIEKGELFHWKSFMTNAEVFIGEYHKATDKELTAHFKK